MSATRRDVARLANVSTATVSYVVNGGPRTVSSETRERVLQAIEQLGYKPNRFASRLARKRNHALGLIVPDNANPFFAQLAHHIEEVTFEAGYILVLCNSNQNVDRELAHISLLREKRVDGILLITAGLGRSALDEILNHEIPLVVLDREIPGAPVDTVVVDNREIGRRATKHLIAHGYHRIGCLAGPSSLASVQHRVEGYRETLERAGIVVNDLLIAHGEFTVEGGYRGARQLFGNAAYPMAIFACNDQMALGALQAASDEGLEVPRDVAVIGVDDTFLAVASVPRLTTVAQPIAEMGRLAATMLLDRVRGIAPLTLQRRILGVNLVIRESCGCASSRGQRSLADRTGTATA